MMRALAIRPVLLAMVLVALATVIYATPAAAASITVTTTADENGTGGGCSLREAVQSANADADFGGCTRVGAHVPDLIFFAASPTGTPIVLTGGEIVISGDVQLIGSTLDPTIVDGNGAGRVFRVAAGSVVTMFALTIRNGRADDGGGISNAGTLTLNLSSVSGNVASGFGGGIFNASSGTLTVEDTTLSGNSGVNGGSGIANGGSVSSPSGGTVAVTRSTLNNGSGGLTGGGIYNAASGTVTVTNSTFSTNSVAASIGSGGGIANSGGTVTVTNSTFSGNAALGSGGADTIRNFSGTVRVRSTILDRAGLGPNCDGPITTLGSNVADDASCSLNAALGDKVVANVMLGPLADDNVGQPRTHVLLPGSPAIDAVVGVCDVADDQRRFRRPQDGDANGSAICDSGAVERAPGRIQFSAPSYFVDESGPTVTIPVIRLHGDEGNVQATVTVGGGGSSAISGQDYVAIAPFQVSFNDGGDGLTTFTVTVLQDTLNESTESVLLTLSNPTGGAAIGDQGVAVLNILDDDPTPTLSVDDVTIAEGTGGTVNAVFTVSLSVASGQTVTVVAQTADDTATVAAGDYTAAGPATLTFPPGTLTQTFTVQAAGDAVAEGNERFFVNLSGAVNATIADGQGVGAIQDDDTPGLRIGDATAVEGDAGTSTLTFTVTLNTPSSQQITVPFTVAGQSASGGAACGANVDFVTAGGTLTFQPLGTTETIAVTVCADVLVEGNESLLVNLGTPTVGVPVVDAQAVGTITDDDVAGALSFGTTSIQVPESAGSVTLTVQRSGGTGPGATSGVTVPTGSVRPGEPTAPTAPGTGNMTSSVLIPITVSFATADGTAKAGQDYQPVAGTLTFGPNETTKTITVPILADGLVEGPETFTVTLSNPTGGATLGVAPTVTVTIVDIPRVTASPNSRGDDDTDDPPKETEDERRQRERTNRGGKDDEHVEGNVLKARCEQAWPSAVIANRDGLVEVRLVEEAAASCRSIRPGDYLEANGEKQHEHLFHATDVSISRPGR